MSGWISPENVFVASTRKGETLPKLADPLRNELFVVLEEGKSFSAIGSCPEDFALRAEQRLETVLRCFQGHTTSIFGKNIYSEEDLRSRIFGTFVVRFLACLPLLGFSNI